MSFDNLGLLPVLNRALSEQGYTTPTQIQREAIPLALNGKDLLAGAQTGTGKTAAFTLPLLQRLYPEGRRVPSSNRKPRALVLTPTRELAAQVHDSLRTYGKHIGVTSTAIFGGVGMGPQFEALRRGMDVLVATPGRLIDHIERRSVDLSSIEILVLDEADRMLDMGFMPALKRILSMLPKQRQTLLFSATFAEEIKQLAAQFTRDAIAVQVAPSNSVATTVTHIVHPVDSVKKRDLLVHLLALDSRKQTLVFGRTKHGCDRLCRQLEEGGFKAAAIHGNKTQGARTRALKDFKNGRVTVLVATDIAARGLDIDQLPVVINYDLPMVAEDYVHRIGRTGRAGSEGTAISLVSHEESGLLRDIQRMLKRDINIETIAGYEPSRPLRMGTDAPRPRQGNGGQRSGAPQRPQSRSFGGGSYAGADRSGGAYAGAERGRGRGDGPAAKPTHARRPHHTGPKPHAAGNKKRRDDSGQRSFSRG